jgi:hypothetical protein
MINNRADRVTAIYFMSPLRPSGMKITKQVVPPDSPFMPELKNAFDFRAFKKERNHAPDHVSIEIFDGLNLGIGVPDGRKGYLETCKLQYKDNTTIRGLIDRLSPTPLVYILPTPPLATWDRKHFYITPSGRKVPRDLWEIMFYTLKPWMDEEACNMVRQTMVQEIDGIQQVVMNEFGSIIWNVLKLYTHVWSNRNFFRAEEDAFNKMGIDAFNKVMEPAYERNGDCHCLNESDWTKIMYDFSEAFVSMFDHVLVPCANCNITLHKLQINDRKMLKCSACKVTCYCSRKCQKTHWKIHKPICREVSNPKSKVSSLTHNTA